MKIGKIVKGASKGCDMYAFELLPQHLEHEALQTYEQWMEAHWMELCQVEWY